MSVNDSLDRMEELCSRLSEEGKSNAAGSTATIIGLRQEFAIECGNLLKAYCDEPRIFGDRALFTELQEGLELVRARMGNHQLRWQGESIAKDPDAYRSASEKVNAAVSNYIVDARARIATPAS